MILPFISFTGLWAQEYGKPIWENNLIDPVTALTKISDVSDDGLPDVLAGTGGDMVFCIESREGEQWWSSTTNGTVWSLTGIGDVNGDDQEDVVAGTAFNEIHCFSGGSAYGIGIELWKVSDLGGDIWCLASINDINQDGCSEALAGTANNKVICLSGKDGDILWSFPTGSDVFSVASFSDITGDGKEEVIAGCGDGWVYCIDGVDGQFIWAHNAGGTVWRLESFDDVDKDGVREVLVGTGANTIVCISGGNSSLSDREIWTGQAQGDIYSLIDSDDMSGDGARDVFGGSGDNYLYLYDGMTGETLRKDNLSGEVFSVVLIQDLDCDRKGDVVCGTQMSSVNCLSSGSGEILWYYPFETSGSIKHVISIPDTTGDQIAETVAASTNGMVVCLNGSAEIKPGCCGFGILPWLMLLLDD